MLIDPNASKAAISTPTKVSVGGNTAFRMIKGQNDRMAGSMPVTGTRSFAANIAEASAATETPSLTAQQAAAIAPEAGDEDTADTAGHGFSFKDFMDVINPLQHIPIVSAIYQHITGDIPCPAAEIIGGGLFGGPIGAVAGGASAAIRSAMNNTPPKQNDEFAQVIKSVATPNDTTVALANLRQGYTPYNA